VFKRPKAGMKVGSIEMAVVIPRPLEEACKNFEQAVGGRDNLVGHLVHASNLTEDQEYLIGAIADPRNDARSLARICTIYEIKFTDLLQLFRNAGLVKAQLAAMQKVWTRLPEVAGDLMDRATTHTLTCPRCRGDGKIPKSVMQPNPKEPEAGPVEVKWEELCPECDGRGEQVVQPSLEVQKIALQLGGLLDKGGPAVQVNVQQNNLPPAAGNHSDFLKRADEKLYTQPGADTGEGEEEPIDVEAEEIDPNTLVR
jgi:hypothetical protein